jgi:glycosyltransferase involved in cell wall biosynthesis
MITLIVCTYRRADDLERLLHCLLDQTEHGLEILVVDGSGTDSAVRDRVAAWMEWHPGFPLRLISAPTGLTRQRNVGLAAARGDLVGFLDDDVTVEPSFCADLVRLFALPEMRDVGGVTGFDVTYYPQPITGIWHLRRWLGVIPGLTPGATDRLGRRVPVEFATVSQTHRAVGWLPGFCMIFRREAVRDQAFDEELPTYAGEDKEFSMAVGAAWSLALRADLLVAHHRSPASRDDEANRTYQVGFGMGRGFARRVRNIADYVGVARYSLGETLVQLLRFFYRPSRERLRVVGALPRGILAGFASHRRREPGLAE